MSLKKVFVTVGTTQFDDLITTVLGPPTLKALASRGYQEITLQIGQSSLNLDCTPRHGFASIQCFHLNPNIRDYVNNADLVISHAGAGSILETLDANKYLIVVTNDLLMHNHQLELAEQLYNENRLFHCTCRTLCNVIETMDLSKLKPFLLDNSRSITDRIDKVMGFL